MGSSISLGGSRNDYGTSINLGYTEPYFTKDGVSLGVTFSMKVMITLAMIPLRLIHVPVMVSMEP